MCLILFCLLIQVNGRLVLEGALRIHWGVLGMIHLKEDDDQRTVVTIRKRNSCRSGIFNGVDFEVSIITHSLQVHRRCNLLQDVLMKC
jgi:hypothetical protein